MTDTKTTADKFEALDRMTADERRTCHLAIGRIFRLGSRPEEPGDVAEYERCRGIIMEIAQRAGAL